MALTCLSSLVLLVGCSFGSRVGRKSREQRGLVRSSPIRFAKRGSPNELPKVTYPINWTGVLELRDTSAVSVRWFDHDQVQRAVGPGLTWEKTVLAVWSKPGTVFHPGFKPSHPEGDAADTQHYWADFREVLAAQQMRRTGALTRTIMPVHPLFEPDETMERSAQRVRSDFPTDFPTMQIKRFLQMGGLRLDPQIFQREECGASNEFVNGAVALSGLIGWAITEVSPGAFGSKWHVGRLRPEEAALLVLSGELDADEDIRNALAGMDLEEAASFTAYEEGSPVHPAWPAMHSAASSMSAWLEVVADLTETQRAEVRLLDYSIAYWRTFAGVHYATDNRAGLALGQYIVKRKLPKHLASMYSCSGSVKNSIEKYVKSKVKLLEKTHPLDWASWTPEFWKSPTLRE